MASGVLADGCAPRSIVACNCSKDHDGPQFCARVLDERFVGSNWFISGCCIGVCFSSVLCGCMYPSVCSGLLSSAAFCNSSVTFFHLCRSSCLCVRLSLVCLVGLLVCVVLLGFGFAFSSWRSPLFKVCMLILSHPGFDDATALSKASFDSVIGSCLSLQFESLHIPQKGNRQHVNSSTPVALDSLGMSEPPSRNALRMVILGIFLVAAFFN